MYLHPRIRKSYVELKLLKRKVKNMYKQLRNPYVRQITNGGKKLHGLSPQANYTDRATTACRRSDCQLLRIEGATWSA
jgi:hypothetical protein